MTKREYMGKRLLIALAFLYLIYQACPAFSQRPEIRREIQALTPESYKLHFDSLRTGRYCSRKVVKASKQSNDHDACRDYIFRYFKRILGEENVYLHHFNHGEYQGLANVLGFKRGTDPNAGIWLVGAHYDTNNNLELFKKGDNSAPGANDNGTGLAAMLEILRILQGVETEKSILFAAWDCEEIFTNGMATGSNAWFREYIFMDALASQSKIYRFDKIAVSDLKGNLNLDMFGNAVKKKDGKPVLWACYGHENHEAFVKEYAATMMEYVPEIIVEPLGVLTNSDHYTFAARGIPAVENLEASYQRDPFYHTTDDYFENHENIDFQFAVDVTRGALAFLLEETLPSFNAPNIQFVQASEIIAFETGDAYYLKSLNSRDYRTLVDVFGNNVSLEGVEVGIGMTPDQNGLYCIVYREGGKTNIATLELRVKPKRLFGY